MGPNMKHITVVLIALCLIFLGIAGLGARNRMDILSCRLDLKDAHDYNKPMPECVKKLGIKTPDIRA